MKVFRVLNRRVFARSIAYVLLASLFAQPFLPIGYALYPLAAASAAEPAATAPSSPVEVPERRTAESEHFDNGDGTFTAKIYPTPIHYQENGSWKKINSKIRFILHV